MTADATDTIRIAYFSDILCVWAYTAQARVDELEKHFGADIALNYHFLPIFGNTAHHIGHGVRHKGGFAGYHKKVVDVCNDFPHVQVHPDIWSRDVPPGSGSCHHFLKAVQWLADHAEIDTQPNPAFAGRCLFEETVWQTRLAFFRDLRNVATRATQMEIAEQVNLPVAKIQTVMDSGEAMASYARSTRSRAARRLC